MTTFRLERAAPKKTRRAPARAEENPAVVDALSGYMDFAEYGSSLIWPEQIPAEDWKKVFIVDARDAARRKALDWWFHHRQSLGL